MMKAVTQSEFGGPEVLELQSIDRPAPGSGQVLIVTLLVKQLRL